MELILTEKEKSAETWNELDDASIGKVVKADMYRIKETAVEQDKMLAYAAALILCNLVVKTNADILKHTIKGLTIKGEPFGDWKVTVKRVLRG